MSEPEAEKVWVVLEGPDMTYYGDAILHGIYRSKEGAEAKVREVWPNWRPADAEIMNQSMYQEPIQP